MESRNEHELITSALEQSIRSHGLSISESGVGLKSLRERTKFLEGTMNDSALVKSIRDQMAKRSSARPQSGFMVEVQDLDSIKSERPYQSNMLDSEGLENEYRALMN